MPDTTHQEEVSTTEARQGRRRTGLLSVMGIVIALVGMLLVLALTGMFAPASV